MLLDPFEEKLHLPAALVQIADRQSWPHCQVSQENECLSGLGIPEADTPDMLGVVLLRIMPIQRDGLIGDHAGSAIGRGRIYAMRVEIGFGAGHEKGAGLVQPIQTSEIDVPAIHHINCARFRHDHIKRVHIVQLSVGNVDEARDVAAQIQQGVHLHRGFGGPEVRPREQRQTQIYGGRIQRVNGGVQVLQQALAHV